MVFIRELPLLLRSYFEWKNIDIILNVMYSVTKNKQKQTRLKVGYVSSFFCEITVHTALFLCY